MGSCLNHCLICGIDVTAKKEKRVRFLNRVYFVHSVCESDFRVRSAEALEMNVDYFLLSNKGKELDSKHIGIFERKAWLSGGGQIALWARTLKLGIRNDEDWKYEFSFAMFEKLFKCRLEQPSIERGENSTRIFVDEDSKLHYLIDLKKSWVVV